MATLPLFFKTAVLVLMLALGFGAAAQKQKTDDGLVKEIMHMDSVLFNAFNGRDTDALKAVFDKDLEFYHDKGGVSDYEKNLEAFKGLFARVPDIRRELVAGSTEVYPINGYGAIQTGRHRFCHQENGKDDCGIFKFLHIWKRTPEGWKVTRIVSYDH